jgi:DHA1 family multidrug resistance protein-like MFS transporter
MVLRSSLAISICIGLMGLAQNVWHLLALRVLMGVFAGFTAASVVLVASQVPERRLGYALGLLSTGQLVGSLVGPVLGGVLRDVSGSDRMPFFVAGGIGFVAFVLCWWLVPERFTRPTEHKKRAGMVQSMRAMGRTQGLSALVLVLLLTQFGVMAIQPVITLFVQQLVGALPNLGTLSGLAFSATGLAGVAAVPVLGRWSDGFGYRRVLLVCLAGAALLTAPQAFVGGYGVFVALRFGVGLFVGGIVPAANALIGRLTPSEDRGFTYGMTSSAYFLGNALGPLTGGVVSATLGLNWVFLLTTILLFANLTWVWLTVPSRIGIEET